MKRWRLLMLGLLALCLCGCGGHAVNVLNVQAGPGGLSSKQVQINDRGLERRLQFGEVSVRALGSSYEAQVVLQNTSRRDLDFEYRFIWYDAAGFEASPLTAWIPSRLGAGEGRGFRSVAPTSRAVRFQCMIRKPRPLSDMGS